MDVPTCFSRLPWHSSTSNDYNTRSLGYVTLIVLEFSMKNLTKLSFSAVIFISFGFLVLAFGFTSCLVKLQQGCYNFAQAFKKLMQIRFELLKNKQEYIICLLNYFIYISRKKYHKIYCCILCCNYL